MFDAFQNRLIVEGFLVSETALRIGIGRDMGMGGTELPVMRDTDGQPYIPGSSFKGALRSYLEAVVRGMGAGAGWEHLACDPNSDNDTEHCISAKKMRQLRKHSKNDAELTQAVMDESCLICQTFGSSWLASHVLVEDLPVAEGEWFDQYKVRDGVAIDRDKGTVAGKQLYNYEVVPAGTRFRLRVVADNLDDWQRGLMWRGIRALERGDVAVGGFTSRGLGWVRLVGQKVRFIEGAAAFIQFLADGQEETLGCPVEDSEAQAWIGRFCEEVKERGNHAQTTVE